MATVIRPPLVSPRQYKRPILPVDLPPRSIALNPVPRVQQLSDSAPYAKRILYGLPITRPLTLGIDTVEYAPASVEFEDAPFRVGRLSQDAYPNLLTTTLAATTPLALPLLAARWSWSAPAPKPAVQVDVYQNPVVRQPVPRIQQWDGSAPPRKAQVRIDTYPNLSLTVLLPVNPLLLPQAAVRWDASAPIAKTAWRVDQPLIRSIALNPVPQVQRLDQSAPPPKKPVYVDVYANVRPTFEPLPPLNKPLGYPVDLSTFQAKYQVRSDVFANTLPLMPVYVPPVIITPPGRRIVIDSAPLRIIVNGTRIV